MSQIIKLTGWNPLWSRNSRAAWQKKPNLSPSFLHPYMQPAEKNLQGKMHQEIFYRGFCCNQQLNFVKNRMADNHEYMFKSSVSQIKYPEFSSPC